MALVKLNNKIVKMNGKLVTLTSLSDEVVIGTQTWKSTNTSTPVANSYRYNNDPALELIYGRLYNYDNITDLETANPGWRIPTTADWGILIDFLGGETVAAGYLKEPGLTHWLSPNPVITPNGFNGLPGGLYASASSVYIAMGYTAWLMEVPDYPGPYGNLSAKTFTYDGTVVTNWSRALTDYVSVRLVKN